MNNLIKSLILTLFMLAGLSATSQEKFNLSGYVRDAANGEELISATVYTPDNSSVVSTNVYGFYSMPLVAGTYEITFSYIGYDNFTKTFTISENITFDVELSTSSVKIEEALVKGDAANGNVKDIEMSVSEMDIKTITKIPALLGEADVIRAVQTMPGVTTVGEGASGFNVRGGGIDENLILIDEAPVYNSSHLFGFFSVFNPDAVKNVKLIKGGIPAEYGGRLSSILDVRMKDGNKKKFTGQGGIGSIFSRLTLEGPLVKDKASFIVAGRRSYIDVLAKPFLSEDFAETKFNFFDLTGKVNWRMNENNNFFVSAYNGGDVIGFDFFSFNWGNTTATARWNHIFNNKIFMNVTGIYADYKYGFDVQADDDNGFKLDSRIQTYQGKVDLTYFANQANTIKGGVSSNFYTFTPAEATFASEGQSSDISIDDKYAVESAVYVQNEQKVTDRLTLQYGLRFSMYQYLGGRDIYTIEEAATAGEQSTITGIDSSVGRWESAQTHSNFEPRFAANLSLNEVSSLKASYNRTAQYIHLLSNTVGSSPVDVWTPSTNNIRPTKADQVAVGYFRNFKNNEFEFSTEAYYKETQNVVDYINGADILINEELERDLLRGDARAYGVEFYLKKNQGNYTGWVSYTISKTERIVDGISNSEWFPNRYDKPHNFNINVSRQVSKRTSVSLSFTYASGTPATFPTNRVDVQGWLIPHNSNNERNSFRVPAYHRADIGAIIDGKERPDRKWEGQVVISIYNLYARRNPYLYYFQQTPDVPNATEAIRYSVVGSLIPSVTYNFNF
ncbi:MAG: TonB-dependent receptor [Flavobacteriales bacterium]